VHWVITFQVDTNLLQNKSFYYTLNPSTHLLVSHFFFSYFLVANVGGLLLLLLLLTFFVKTEDLGLVVLKLGTYLSRY